MTLEMAVTLFTNTKVMFNLAASYTNKSFTRCAQRGDMTATWTHQAALLA